MANPRGQAGKSDEPEKPGSRTARASQRNDILATAAHDLLGPVGAIILFTELLEEEVRDRLDTSQRELLSSIRSAGELVMKLVEDLLAVSRRGAPLALEPVDLVSLANECIALHQPEAKGKTIALALTCDAPPPPVRLDRLKLIRVVSELLANAIRFSNPGQNVEVRLSLRGRIAEIAVRDEGKGISSKDRKKLFVPFYKGAASGSTAGRGLGLAIAKSIVSAHRGRIRVMSQPGAGSTFTISLPTNM